MPENAPPVSRELVEFLERIIPDRSPDVGDSLDEIRFASGRVSVVRYLRRLYEHQTTP